MLTLSVSLSCLELILADDYKPARHSTALLYCMDILFD